MSVKLYPYWPEFLACWGKIPYRRSLSNVVEQHEFRDNWFSEINSSFKDIKILPYFLHFYPTGKKNVRHRRCLGIGLALLVVTRPRSAS
jgi:hypothetical protein